MEYGAEMLLFRIIYVPSFMKIDAGVLAILRICLRNLRGCNVAVTDGWDLWII
jgi:hypothetical protein